MPVTKHYQIIFTVQYSATVAVADHVTPEQAMRMISLPTEEIVCQRPRLER